MKVTDTVELTPVCVEGVWHVEWTKAGTVEDDKFMEAWNRYSKKRCLGGRGRKKRYSSEEHATEVILSFKDWWSDHYEPPKPNPFRYFPFHGELVAIVIRPEGDMFRADVIRTSITALGATETEAEFRAKDLFWKRFL